MKVLLAALLICLTGAAPAQEVIVIGEVHDNPHHHAEQAARVARIAPAALVMEMLTPEQAARITPAARQSEDALRELLDWDDTGWPDFAMYYPIFAAAPGARIFGAGLTRDAARAAIAGGNDGPMAGEASLYGLDEPLPEAEQRRREALQMQAHCNALPEAMLPGMVRVQRLRDAMLARAAIRADAETGGPVVVITGNGHARKDWGAPALIARAAPGLDVYVIGQTEDGLPLPGDFDAVLSSPMAEREDPCAGFR